MEPDRKTGSIKNPELELHGDVVCRDVADTRAVHRFVQKWIRKWVALRKPNASETASYFHVTFSREGPGHAVACQTRLRVGTEFWTAASYGASLSEALKDCLTHMIPVRLSAPLSARANLYSVATR